MNTKVMAIEAKYEELFNHQKNIQLLYQNNKLIQYSSNEYFKMFIDMLKYSYEQNLVISLDNEKYIFIKIYTTLVALINLNQKSNSEKTFGISFETLYEKFLNGSFTY